MLRQKRYFMASVALTLLISGCGLKGSLYQKDQVVSKKKLTHAPIVVTPINNSSATQE